MESAERNGSDLRRVLCSADDFNDAAIRFGSCCVNTPFLRVSASLCSVTWRDQRRFRRAPAGGVPVFLMRLVRLRDLFAMTSPFGSPFQVSTRAPILGSSNVCRPRR